MHVCVTATKPLDFTVILGMNGIKALGGVTIDAQGEVHLINESVVCSTAGAVLGVDEYDFSATYDLEVNSWAEAWKWMENKETSVLQNRMETYSVPHDVRNMYKEELHIYDKGWMVTAK